MLERALPRSLDNNYQGHGLALWMLGALLLFKGLMGVMCILKGSVIAVRTDGIPLHTFTPEGARAVVAFLALWGWSLLLLCLLGALALLRYRAMVPLVYLLLLAEQLGRKWILTALPISASAQSPAVSINTVLFAWMLAGLALSLWARPNRSLGDPT